MAACMAKGGVGSYARQGWASGDGVWEWDSRTLVSLGSQSRGGKRQLEGAESGRGMGGWVEEPDMRDKEEEAERDQQQRQRWRRSQVRDAAGGAAPGGEAPQEEMQAKEVQEECEEWVGS